MSAAPKRKIPLQLVTERIRQLPLPEADAVVAIERGGLTPAMIAAEILECPLGRLRLLFRDDLNSPMFQEPQLLSRRDIPSPRHGHLLVVDDVSVTGATLRRAVDELHSFRTTTLVLRGEADLVAFPGLQTCVTWPWSQHSVSEPANEARLRR